MSKTVIYNCDMCGHKIVSDKTITSLNIKSPEQFIYDFELCDTCATELIQKLLKAKKLNFY